MEFIPKQMSSRHRLIVFLVAVVNFLEKNLTAFLIVESLIEGYMLKALTEAFVILSLFNYSSSSFPFRSDAWTMEKRE